MTDRYQRFPERTGGGLGFIAGIALAVVAFFFGTTVVFGSWYTIDQTERGVLLRNGAVVGTAQPGLGFKLPLVDSVYRVPITTKTWSWDKMSAYSYDQQEAHLRVSVTAHVAADKVVELYSSYGTLDAAVSNLLSPHVPQQVKVVFGQYTAANAIQKRGKLNLDIKDEITKAQPTTSILVIDSVQLENIDFSAAYVTSIEQRMLAEVEVQRLEQNAQREKVQAQITVTQAQAIADSVVAKAKAEADAIRLRGNAEATAIQARGDALAKNPGLVNLVQAERWDGKLPTSMIPGGALPMVSLR